jgi:hypothetical protein
MESGKKTLEELTTAGVFHVPEYQRYYSWTEAEWDDLWTDLSTLPADKQHYFGTVILQRTDETETARQDDGYGSRAEQRVNLLVDGQQRLTSLVVLVSAMADRLAALAPQTDHEAAIQADVTEMRETLLVEDGIRLLELLDAADSEYLERVVDDRPLPEPQRPSQRKMRAARRYFDARIAELADRPGLAPLDVANRLKRLWDAILGLELMVYVVDADNPEKATLIFDSVNDRGRSLSTFDKTKSFLMRMAYLAATDQTEGRETIRRIRQAFGRMYDDHQRMLESPHGEDISDDAVQRYHFISFFDWSGREDHQTPAFLDRLKSHVRSLQETDPAACLAYIRAYTDSLERGFAALADVLDDGVDDAVGDLVDRLHRLRHARKFYPMLLTAWPELDDDGRRELLDAIETYVFRVYAIGNHPTYTGRSSIQTLTRDTARESPVDVWVQGLVEVMNRYEDDAQFRRSLAAPDLYTKVTSRDLRYLLYYYNEHRADQEGETGSLSLEEATGEEYTVEHVWPQQPGELPIDPGDSGEFASAEQRYDAYKHRLGNLTLASTAWNAEWGNAGFQRKRAEGYENSKLWVQWELRDYDEWSVEAIESRERALIEFVMDRWATPETRFGDLDSPRDAIPALTDRERAVLRALCGNPDGAARRVIHRDAAALADSPFHSPGTDGEERAAVGTILGRLVGVGLAQRDGHTWYPSDEARFARITA